MAGGGGAEGCDIYHLWEYDVTKKEQQFVETVWEYYRRHGRRRLPWRRTKNPYRILVSEVMLQQTQVERVLPKYTAFLKKFPTLTSLASASLGDVLREWQGLGYNRRAKMLHLCAQIIVNEHGGRFPKTYSALIALPGIGHYTAGAVMAFAYNESSSIIETNIRTAFIQHFFHNEVDIADTQLFPLIGIVLDRENPREWYYALMDYGAFLKKTVGNQNVRSQHYAKQSIFNGSDRQVRGAILRLLAHRTYTRKKLHSTLPFSTDRIDALTERLIEEGLITHAGRKYALP